MLGLGLWLLGAIDRGGGPGDRRLPWVGANLSLTSSTEIEFTVQVRVVDRSVELTDCHTRLPFRFGVHTLTKAPYAVARVRVESSQGEYAEGYAAELLVPHWFEKNLERSIAGDIRSLTDSVIAAGGPGAMVNEVSGALLGGVGGVLAIVAVIVLPITSGDTAFRSTRLILADVFQTSQKTIRKRLMLAVPLFVVGFIVSQVDFQVIWRYFGWANQTLATLVLWSAAVWLKRSGRLHWIATVPATFMTSVVVGFFVYAPIAIGADLKIAQGVGIAVAVLSCIACCVFVREEKDDVAAEAESTISVATE